MSAVALLLAFALLLMKRRMEKAKTPPGVKPFNQMPSPSGGNFILGHLLLIDPVKMHSCLTAWANKLGGIFRIRILNINIVCVSDPKIFTPILGSGDQALPKHFIYNSSEEFHGPNTDSMFNMKDFRDKKYKVVRKELAMAFSTKQMKESLPSLIRAGRSLVDKWSSGGVGGIPADHDIETAILDHILDSSFKFNFSRADKDVFLDKLGPALTETSLRVSNPARPFLQRLLPFLPSSISARNVIWGCHKTWDAIHNQIKANAPYDPSDMSFSACLWRIEDTHGYPCNDNIALMVTAGFETSSGAIAWALYDIASNPEIQAKLHAEFKTAGLIQSDGKEGRPVTWEDLSLPYLNAVIKESARINPVASQGTIRTTDQDTAIGGYWVPKGAMVFVQLNSVHNSIWNWDDPLSFKPERWLEGGSGNDNPAYIPFSMGPRSCVGQNMAWVTVRVVLLELFSKLRFKASPRMGSREDVRVNQVMSLTLKHQGGIWLIPEKL